MGMWQVELVDGSSLQVEEEWVQQIETDILAGRPVIVCTRADDRKVIIPVSSILYLSPVTSSDNDED